MIHNMKLKEDPFYKIKNKIKDIEMRLYDEKRSLIKKGDIIEFTNITTNEKIKTIVIDLHKYNSFDELYSKFNKIRLGYKEDEKANPYDMEQYYSKDEIVQNGVIGIEIKLIEE